MLNEDGSHSITNIDGDDYSVAPIGDGKVLVHSYDHLRKVSVELCFDQNELAEFITILESFRR